MQKVLAFNISKHNFIYFNNILYNLSNIKGSIFHILAKSYSFFLIDFSLPFLSLSLHLITLTNIHCLHKPTTNHHPKNPNNNPPQPSHNPPQPRSDLMQPPSPTITTTKNPTTKPSRNPQPPNQPTSPPLKQCYPQKHRDPQTTITHGVNH